MAEAGQRRWFESSVSFVQRRELAELTGLLNLGTDHPQFNTAVTVLRKGLTHSSVAVHGRCGGGCMSSFHPPPLSSRLHCCRRFCPCSAYLSQFPDLRSLPFFHHHVLTLRASADNLKPLESPPPFRLSPHLTFLFTCATHTPPQPRRQSAAVICSARVPTTASSHLLWPHAHRTALPSPPRRPFHSVPPTLTTHPSHLVCCRSK